MKIRLKTIIVTAILSAISCILAIILHKYKWDILENIVIGIMGSSMVSFTMELTNYISEMQKNKNNFLGIILWSLIYTKQYINNLDTVIDDGEKIITENLLKDNCLMINGTLNNLNTIDGYFYEKKSKYNKIKDIAFRINQEIANNQSVLRCTILEKKIELYDENSESKTVYSSYIKENLLQQKEKMLEKFETLKKEYIDIINYKRQAEYYRAIEVVDKSC